MSEMAMAKIAAVSRFIADPLSFSKVLLYNSTRRRRSAFAMTDTELKVIAALAIIGLSNRPTNG